MTTDVVCCWLFDVFCIRDWILITDYTHYSCQSLSFVPFSKIFLIPGKFLRKHGADLVFLTMFCDRSGLIFQHVWPFFVIAELLLKKSVDSRLNLCYSILAGQVKPAEHNEREGTTMKYTKKMINEAPKFAVGIDYKASYKPLTIEVEMIYANDIYEAMAMCDEFFDENTVWCLNFYEKTDRIENDCIMYDEKMQSNRKGTWQLIDRNDFHVAYNPTWSDHEGVLC